MTQYTNKLYPILHPAFTNFEFIKSILVSEYGETYAKSLYFSEDPEDAVEAELYHIQTVYSNIYFENPETGEVLAEIPITDHLTEEQEELLRNFPDSNMVAGAY